MRKIRLISIISVVVFAFCGFAAIACDGDTDVASKPLTATFMYNYPDAPNDGVYKKTEFQIGKSVELPQPPTRKGYDFKKWTVSADSDSAEWSFSAISFGNITFYAQWQATSQAATVVGITVTPPTKTEYAVGDEFDKAGMTVTAQYSDDSSQPVSLDDCEISGYDGDTAGEQTITVLLKNTQFTDTFTITVSAAAEVKYNVVFDARGAVETPAVQKLKKGEKVQKPVDPAKTGYTFDKWYNGGTAWNFDNDVLKTDGLTLTAHYIAKDVTISFDSDVQSVTVKFGEALPAMPEPTKTGHTFAKWTDSAGKQYKTGDVLDVETLSLTAVWVVDKYDVVFSIAGNAVKTVKVEYNTTIAVSDKPAPTRDGYTLGDWCLSGESTAYDFDTKITAAITLTAQWQIIEYTITYNVGDKATAIQQIQYTVEDAFNLPTPTGIESDYSFVGWYTELPSGGGSPDNTKKVTAIAKGTTGDKTFYAYISQLPTYSFIFDYNYAGAPQAYTDSVVSGGTATALNPLPTRPGHTFVNWYNESGCTTEYDFTAAVTATKTVYAKWELKSYTVTFNTGAGSAVNSTTVNHGECVQEPSEPTREGWTFGGWKLDGVTEIYDFTTPAEGNITLVAVWNGTEGVFIYYTIDGGTTWQQGTSAQKNGTANEYVIRNIRLKKDMQFRIVSRKAEGDVWLYGAATITQAKFQNALTVTVAGETNKNFVISELKNNYEESDWDIYICGLSAGAEIAADGQLTGTNVTASSISFEQVLDNALRDPKNEGGTMTAVDTPTAEVYVRGNFTNGFKLCDAWSSSSTAVKVLKSGNVYTFRKLYLKKGDAFKIYVKGIYEDSNDKGWYGGEFVGLDSDIALTNDGSAGNIYLGTIIDGFYDIVYNKGTGKVKIIAYAPPTIASITVEKPTKFTYWQGEPFDATGMTVSTVNTDGDTAPITAENYTLSGHVTTGLGEITVTVTSGDKTATFKITVNALTVTFKSTGANDITVNVMYNTLIGAGKPANPSKKGYTFGGWFDEQAYTTEHDFAAETAKITQPITVYAKWDAVTYNITYTLDDGTNDAGNPATYKATDNSGNPVTLLNATKLGHDFLGWYTSAEGDTPVTTISLDNFDNNATGIALTARWRVTKLTVTFNHNYSGSSNTTEEVEYNNAVNKPVDPVREDYTFVGWFTSANGNTEYAFASLITANTEIFAHWSIINREDGIYVGEGSSIKRIKALVSNGGDKLKVENVRLDTNAKVRFYKNNARLIKNVYVRGETGVSNPKNYHMTGTSYENITVVTGGWFSIYYDPSDNQNENGLWVIYDGAYVAPNLQEDDGIYDAENKLAGFTVNENGANEVITGEITLAADTTITVKYGGAAVAVTAKDNSSLGTFDGGKVTLGSGKYTFVLRYDNKKLVVSGKPDDIKPDASSIVIKCSDGVVKISVVNGGGYTYGLNGVKLEDTYLYVFGDGDIKYTGDWNTCNGKLGATITTKLSLTGIKGMVIKGNSQQTGNINFSVTKTRMHIKADGRDCSVTTEEL